jgi:hypothetical protein
MKRVAFLFMLFAFAFADNIEYTWTPANSDTITGTRYKADRNSVKNVVNGNLTNANVKSTANIAQSKIDSSSGWITNGVGRLTVGSQFVNLRSPYGMRFFINDSTAYNKEWIWVSDSTDTAKIMTNDSAIYWVPVHIQNTLEVDTIKGLDVIAGNPFTDSLTGPVNITGPAGSVNLLRVLAADGVCDNQYAATIRNLEATGGRSFGLHVVGGTNGSDNAFHVADHDEAFNLFSVRGNGDTYFLGTTGNPYNLILQADAGANASDRWRIEIEDGADFNIASQASGSWVDKLSLTNAGNMTITGTASFDSVFSGGLLVNRGIRTDTLKQKSVDGMRIMDRNGNTRIYVLDGTMNLSAPQLTLDSAEAYNWLKADSLHAVKTVKAVRGEFDSIKIGDTWISSVSIGGFVMTIEKKSTSDTVFQDSVFYYQFNDNVALSMSTDTISSTIVTAQDFTGPDTFIVSTIPANLIPATTRTVPLPYTFERSGTPFGTEMGYTSPTLSYLIPNSAANGYIIVGGSWGKTAGPDGPETIMNWRDCDISYSLN